MKGTMNDLFLKIIEDVNVIKMGPAEQQEIEQQLEDWRTENGMVINKYFVLAQCNNDGTIISIFGYCQVQNTTWENFHINDSNYYNVAEGLLYFDGSPYVVSAIVDTDPVKAIVYAAEQYTPQEQE